MAVTVLFPSEMKLSLPLSFIGSSHRGFAFLFTPPLREQQSETLLIQRPRKDVRVLELKRLQWCQSRQQSAEPCVRRISKRLDRLRGRVSLRNENHRGLPRCHAYPVAFGHPERLLPCERRS